MADQAASNTENVNVVSPQDYSEPVEDPYNKAISYLERHNILQLFQQLTSGVIYTRPVDPLDHLIKEVQRMKEERDHKTSAQK